MKYTITPDVGADDFHDFLTYLIFQKEFTAFQIRDVACSPHKFKKEYSDFNDSVNKYKEKKDEPLIPEWTLKNKE